MRLNDDGLDALQVEQVGQHQSGRSGADNSDLRAHAGCIVHLSLAP